MNFGEAIQAMKDGKKVARSGWNGKGMWISRTHRRVLDVDKDDIWTLNIKEQAIKNGGKVEICPYISMKTADNKIQIGWLASQPDILSDDWGIVE